MEILTPELRKKTRKEKTEDRIDEKLYEMMKWVAKSGEDLQENYTPPQICDMLLEKIDLKGNKSILVLYNIEIVFSLYKSKYKGQITFLTASQRKVDFARKLFGGIKIEYISEGENPLLRLEEMKAWPEKFDIIVSNPPYSKRMDLKFLDRCVDLAEEQVVFVHPSSMYVEGKGICKEYNKTKDKIKDLIESLDFFNGNSIFKINLFIPCVITNLSLNKNKSTFVLNDSIEKSSSDIKNTELDNISVFGYNNTFIKFKQKIEKFIEKKGHIQEIGNFIGGGGQDHKKVLANPVSYFIEFTHLRGNIENQRQDRMVKEDFFTIISKENRVKTGINPKYNIWFEFKTEIEANNFLSYIKTDFARMCLATAKINQHIGRGELKFIPLVDFTQEWTDEKLYAHFNITEEEQTFIKEIIPPYYD
jgi:hypothetical protein